MTMIVVVMMMKRSSNRDDDDLCACVCVQVRCSSHSTLEKSLTSWAASISGMNSWQQSSLWDCVHWEGKLTECVVSLNIYLLFIYSMGSVTQTHHAYNSSDTLILVFFPLEIAFLFVYHTCNIMCLCVCVRAYMYVCVCTCACTYLHFCLATRTPHPPCYL